MKCELILSIDYAFEDKWYRTTNESLPTFPQVTEVVKGQYFVIFLLILEYERDENNRAKIVYDIKITRPDKLIYFEHKNLEVVDDYVPNLTFLMSLVNVKICFDPEDPYGEYIVNVIVKDLNGKSQEIEKQINLIKFNFHQEFKNEKEFEEWEHWYHVEPQPFRTVDGFIFAIKSDWLDVSNDGFPYTISFFRELVAQNLYLLPFFVEQYKSQDYKTKIPYLFLFYHFEQEMPDFFKNLGKTEQKLYQVVKDYYETYNYKPYSEKDAPYQLDILWGIFFANGKYKPIFKLVSSLDLNKEKDYALIFLPARWSIESNCKQHRLVTDYYKYIYKNEKLSQHVERVLRRILED